MKSFSRVQLLATPWTAARQAPPSMDFPGKRTGVGCHCLLHNKGRGLREFPFFQLVAEPGFKQGHAGYLRPMEQKWWLSIHKAFTGGCIHLWRRQWHPTPVLMPGKSHGRRSLWATVPGVAKSRARLSGFTFTFHFHALEKEIATHSSVLAWRIPGMVETGRLLSMGLHSIGHD